MVISPNRQERLAALNGESRIFVCADCGKVKHVKDAGARVGRTAGIICLRCVYSDIAALDKYIKRGLYSKAEIIAMERTQPFPGPPKTISFSTPGGCERLGRPAERRKFGSAVIGEKWESKL